MLQMDTLPSELVAAIAGNLSVATFLAFECTNPFIRRALFPCMEDPWRGFLTRDYAFGSEHALRAERQRYMWISHRELYKRYYLTLSDGFELGLNAINIVPLKNANSMQHLYAMH
jgi:hypothetical protein